MLGRYGQDCRLLVLLVVLTVVVSTHSGLVAASETNDQNRAVTLIKVFRQVGQQEVMGCGSGFVVHSDGFIITNNAIVADTVRYIGDDRLQEKRAPVKAITVVMNTGAEGEVELPARRLVQDPKSGLALLKVGRAIDAPMELSALGSAQIDDEITVVGFPVGSACAAPWDEPMPDVVPEIRVDRGEVTGMRSTRMAGGLLIETGIGVTPSHNGGAMLNSNGELVGVVTVGDGAVAEAIPLKTIERFIERCAFKVVFDPPGIFPTLEKFTVDVIPMLGDLDDVTGTVSVEGRDLRKSFGRFKATDFGYRAVVRTDDRMFGVSPPERYDVEIEIRKRGEVRPMERRFRISALDSRTEFEHSTEVYKLEPGPHIPRNHGGLSKYAEDLRGEGTSLAGGDTESVIRRTDSGSLVIDQSTIKAFAGVTAEAFAELESEDDKALASRFEVVFNEFCNLTSEHMIPIPARREGMSDTQYHRLLAQGLRQVGASTVVAWAEYLEDIATEADSLAGKLGRRGIGKCSDGKWCKGKTECNVPTPADCF